MGSTPPLHTVFGNRISTVLMKPTVKYIWLYDLWVFFFVCTSSTLSHQCVNKLPPNETRAAFETVVKVL